MLIAAGAESNQYNFVLGGIHMKRVISLVLAVILVMATAIPAFAVETDKADPAASCDHSGTPREEKQVTYIYSDNSGHLKRLIVVKYCSSCNDFLGYSAPEILGIYAHEHDTGTYVGSTHEGYYTSHSYTYGGICTNCMEYFTWHVQSMCKRNYCVDPY